jgi:signal transduction histidine kinase
MSVIEKKPHAFDELGGFWKLPPGLLDLGSIGECDAAACEHALPFLRNYTSLSVNRCSLINAHCRLPCPIESPADALLLLGPSAVKNLLLCCIAYAPDFVTKADRRFLRAACSKAALSGALCAGFARAVDPGMAGQAFLAGFLHDIGSVALYVASGGRYANLLYLYKKRPGLLLAAELRYGASHCEAGARILTQWKLAPEIIDAVAYHHGNGSAARQTTLLGCVLQQCSRLLDGPAEEPRPAPDAAASFGTSAERILHEAHKEADALSRALGYGDDHPSQQHSHVVSALEFDKSDPHLSAAPVALAERKLHHEVQNAPGIVKNYLKLISLKLRDSGPITEETGIIEGEVDRIARLLRETSGSLKDGETDAGPLDINNLLGQTARIMRESLFDPAGLELHLDFDPALPLVLGNADKLRQAFINIMKNAAEAMGPHGTLHIQTRIAGSQHDTGNGKYTEILISDSGPGFPRDLRTKIFAPVATSKGEGHSGLGLAIAHDSICLCKGSISAARSEHGGACFRILLPAFQPMHQLEDVYAPAKSAHR